jgi:hypothetical protein
LKKEDVFLKYLPFVLKLKAARGHKFLLGHNKGSFKKIYDFVDVLRNPLAFNGGQITET